MDLRGQAHKGQMLLPWGHLPLFLTCLHGVEKSFWRETSIFLEKYENSCGGIPPFASVPWSLRLVSSAVYSISETLSRFYLSLMGDSSMAKEKADSRHWAGYKRPKKKKIRLEKKQSGGENGERRELHTQHHHQEKHCRVLGVLGHKTSRALVVLLCRTAAPLSNPQSLPSVWTRQGCPGVDFPHLGMVRNKRVSFGTCPCKSEVQPQRGGERATGLHWKGAGGISVGVLAQSAQRKL